MATKKKTKKDRVEPDQTTGKKNISSELKALNSDWADAEERAGGDAPDGKYAVQIADASINHSKGSGRLQVSWQLKIVDGDHAGRMLFKHDGIDSAESLSWLRTGLARLGVEWPAKADDLPDVISELVGTFAQVTAKTKEGNDIQNVYFDRAIDGDEIETETEEQEEVSSITKGSRVTATFEDGEDYQGVVTKIKGDDATVKFDDGDVETFAMSDLKLVEDEEEDEDEEEAEEDSEEEEEEEEEEEDEDSEDEEEDEDEDEDEEDEDEDSEDEDEDEDEDEEEDEDEDEEVATVTSKKGPSVGEKSNLKGLAKKHNFDPSEYDKIEDLAIEMASYLGVIGEFSSWSSLISAMQKAKKAKK